MISTYQELKDEVISWSHRDDLDLKVDNFIVLAESEMFANTVEPLQLRGEETTTTLYLYSDLETRLMDLPTGYSSMRKLRIQVENGESVELKYRTPAQLNILSTTGMPRFFTVTSGIEFDRVPDQDYTGEIQYYKDFTALSSANTTNTVLTNHPTIYLFGAMWALKLYTEELQEAVNYYQQFINSITGANNKDKLGRYGPAPMMRAEKGIP